MIFDSAIEITEKIYNTWKNLLLPEHSNAWKINYNSPKVFLGGGLDKRISAGGGAGVKWNFPWFIHQFISNYRYIVKGDVQLFRYDKMTRIWKPTLPLCLHLFNFGNPPPHTAKVQNFTSTSIHPLQNCLIL